LTDLGNGLFAVSVPDKAEIQFSKERIAFITDEGFETLNPKFDFEILGTVTKDNIDFDVEPYVETHKNAKRYLDYTAERKYFDYPEISFRSLLSSKGLFFENPYGDKEPNYLYRRNKWQQAQNNLIEKLVIIKKV